ncbi:hypothetical protein G6O67_003494 [Ophiocordyceps sinensis]|uniref:Gas1-like protein n=1 Tax=Ophiocordyceps sinensis TaxID=72228 RepID=A0A8H4PWG0_9HYPO|nr:hypothetical protein G6O67_003494 [Ophiocordyceps sinensis]
MDATCGQGFSNGFGMVDGIPRDDDSPDFAQVDSAIIRNAENEKNMSNKCGRTLLSNIDVAKETEKALKFNITQCEAGATLKFTLHMEIEVTLNAPGEQGLNPDAPKGENFPMTVKLPADMNCKGGTTGNVCTLRCRNLSVAGPFGGCIAIQQIGGKQDDPLLNDPPRIDPPGNSLEPNDQEQNDQEQGGGGRGPRLLRRRVNQAGQSKKSQSKKSQSKKSQSKKVVNKNIKANGGGGGNNDNKDKDNGGKGGDGGGKNDINNKNNNNDKNDNDKNNDNGNDNGGKGGDGGNNKNNDNNNKINDNNNKNNDNNNKNNKNNGGNGENNDFAPGTKIVSPDQIRTQDKAEDVKKLSEELNISVPKLIKEREDAERGDKAGGENQDQGAGVVGAKQKNQQKNQQKGGQDKKKKQ